MECQSKIKLHVTSKYGNKVYSMTVPCGRCAICLANKRMQYFYRLHSEFLRSSCSFFVTLTYDDEHMPMKNGCQVVSKRDCQLFMKRLRKSLSVSYPEMRFKYFLVSEYGTHTFRPHYHAVFFIYDMFFTSYEFEKFISKAWQNGNNLVCETNASTINYSLKDMLKLNVDVIKGNDIPTTFRLSSKGLGESKAYDLGFSGWHNPYVVYQEKKIGLPRYMREKMFEVMDADTVLSIKDDIEKSINLKEENEKKTRQKWSLRDVQRWFSIGEATVESIIHRAKKNGKL